MPTGRVSNYLGWERTSNGGWLEGRPCYTKDKFYIAEDYDNPEESAKIIWFLHDDSGLVGAYPTLRDAMNAVKES